MTLNKDQEKRQKAWAISYYGKIQPNEIFFNKKMACERLKLLVKPRHCGSCECDYSDLDIKIVPISIIYKII